jgi:hypothetical protein
MTKNDSFVMITSSQCRATERSSIGCQQWLADAAQVRIITVRQFEGGGSRPRRSTLHVMRRAFEAGGVIFVDENGGGPGVRLKKSGAFAGKP